MCLQVENAHWHVNGKPTAIGDRVRLHETTLDE
jgi:hypothetical protein